MNRVCYRNHPTHRRGSLLTEAIIAAIVLGVAISMLVPALTAIGRQRQAIRFETLAMIELNNIEEILQTSNAQAEELKVSEWFSKRYAEALFSADVLTEQDDISQGALECLRLTFSRPQAEAMPHQKVSLVVWRPRENPTP